MNLLNRYRSLALALVLVVLSLIVITLSIGRDRELTRVERYAVDLLAPAQKAVMGVVRSISSLVDNYFLLVETSKENIKLRDELARLSQDLVLYRESYLANQRLRRLLEFREGSELPLTAAEVVSYDSTGLYKTITIDKGLAEGLSSGMAVIGAEGVVGRIVKTGNHYSQVLLLTDRGSGVDALVQNSRARGILKGTGSGKCRLEYVIRNVSVNPGDVVITSGLAGLFPKGLILGRVSSVDLRDEGEGLFQTIIVEPSIDFDRLEEVLVTITPNVYFQGADGDSG